MEQHKKFFDKAKSPEYLKEHFLKGLKPLTERDMPELFEQGEYYKKQVKNRITRLQQPKKISQAWNFSSAADWGNLIEEE
jgi:hypothetical protein